MKTYLVTGGAGFIGSNFVKYLFEKYNQDVFVINYDALTYAGNLYSLMDIEDRQNYCFVKGDIGDRQALNKLFSETDIDYVVNFAAESHVDRSISNPSIFVETNVLGTQVLLDVAMAHWRIGDISEDKYQEGKKFLQVSTDEVYGSLGKEGFFTEDTPINPHSPYSASKASADMLVKAYHDTFGFPINITRCSNNYGPHQFPEKLIPLIIANALKGDALPVYGDGKNVRDWLYVEDHCKAIDMVIEKGILGEVYNIGGHNEKENIEIVTLIIKHLAQTLEDDDRAGHISNDLIKYVTDRKGHDLRYGIDPAKIQKDIGWSPSVMFDEGILKTIRWYLFNESWLNKVEDGSYLEYYHNFLEYK